MKRRTLLLSLVGLLLALYVGSGLRPGQPTEPYDLEAWGGLPVQHQGRIKPLDTVARTSLLLLRAKQTVRTDEVRLTATEWLWELVFHAEAASRRPVFRIDQPDLVSLLGFEPGTRTTFSYAELIPSLPEIDRQFQRVPPEAAERTQFETAVAALFRKLFVYQSLEGSFVPPPMGATRGKSEGSLAAEIARFEEILAALPKAGEPGRPDPMFNAFLSRYRNLAGQRGLEVIPQEPAEGPWLNLWSALADDLVPAPRPPAVLAWARVTDAARGQNPEAFNAAVADLRAGPLAPYLAEHRTELRRETRFNAFNPFYRAEVLYVGVFLLTCAGWMRPSSGLFGPAAFLTLAVAFVLHTAGLAARMSIQSLPPVTNLYSSAVFIGWAAVGLGLFLERLTRNGLGNCMAALAGFTTLIIASHLSLSGDTMEQMRAVLNSNFWLATHVITISVGYAAAFVAGLLAILFLARGALSRRIDRKAAQTIEKAVIGTVCFTLFFSFVGTVLGGVWADQSWGRFWGWDPKENGALLIVIWNALILHAFAARILRRRGLMLAAIGGNIVTSWSWFGTNMLGIGLHSYGFMSDGFRWLLLFWLSQFFIIAAVLVFPRGRWRSPEALDLSAPKA
jgi:ABC-type transport system involved in cytochrome c biogenesis permease subunit